jgi:hypothetical protein
MNITASRAALRKVLIASSIAIKPLKVTTIGDCIRACRTSRCMGREPTVACFGAYSCAGCMSSFLVIVKSPEITIMFKKQSQRSPVEQQRAERGLGRSLLLEILLFVPVSVALVLLAVAPFLMGFIPKLIALPHGRVAFYSLLGTISHGFPFAAFRKLLTRTALKTLKDFADIALKDGGAERVEP